MISVKGIMVTLSALLILNILLLYGVLRVTRIMFRKTLFRHADI
ncbi:MAG: hypothetical protein OEZ58_14510 [Gammaproteobacteria bacterium]|nr:hypothetical protein [Gammaproteobacteria bacterium]MDH5730205.1 hypothetical protein [Gammaproteobacteria bacterium]